MIFCGFLEFFAGFMLIYDMDEDFKKKQKLCCRYSFEIVLGLICIDLSSF